MSNAISTRMGDGERITMSACCSVDRNTSSIIRTRGVCTRRWRSESGARKIIGRWVEYYNGRRLHASLNYLPPAEYWAGEPRKRLEERKRKLEEGRKGWEEINRKRLQAAA